MSNSDLLTGLSNSFIGQHTEYPTADGKRSPRIYLDSAATTLMMQPAHDLANEFLEHYASTHSDLHYAARAATEAYAWAHRQVLNFAGAEPANYDCFFAGSGATAGFNRIASSLAAARPERNMVLVSEMEHHSNDLPHRKSNPEIIHIRCQGEFETYGGLDLVHLQHLLQTHGDKINYVAVTGASNVTGAITPLAKVAKMVHQVGALLLVDASQMMAHAAAQVSESEIDILVFSGHKIYAPGSPGAVVIKKSILRQIEPDELGGGMVDDVYLDKFSLTQQLPEREEAGTPNIIGAITLGAALKLLKDVGMESIRAKEVELINYLWKALSEIDAITLYGPTPSDLARTGSIAFNIKGLDHGLTAAALNDYYNIQVRNGCFCAHPYVREMLKRELWEADIDPDAPNAEAEVARKRGMARASLGIYTTRAELDALLAALRDLVNRRDEMKGLYQPLGKDGYRHQHFQPAPEDLFDAERSLQKLTQI